MMHAEPTLLAYEVFPHQAHKPCVIAQYTVGSQLAGVMKFGL